MPEREDRRDRDDRERKPKDGGGKPRLSVSGTRAKTHVTVQLPAVIPNTALTFTAGPATNPLRKQVKADGIPVTVPVEPDGVARGEIDMSKGSKDSTHMTACYGGKCSDAVEIPPAESTSGSEDSPKPKRFRITPEDACVETYAQQIGFVVQTFDTTGKAPSRESLRVSADVTLAIYNRETNTLIGNGKVITIDSGTGGVVDIEIEITGDWVAIVTFLHQASGETLTKKLRFK